MHLDLKMMFLMTPSVQTVSVRCIVGTGYRCRGGPFLFLVYFSGNEIKEKSGLKCLKYGLQPFGRALWENYFPSL